MRKIVIATNNAHKAKEISDILPDYTVLTLADFDFIGDIEENGETFLDNAMIKAREGAKITKEIVIADDSGLEVDYLGGAPGVHSKRFADTDKERIEKLLSLLTDVEEEKRGARFKCTVAIANDEEIIATFVGVVQGKIGYAPEGDNGFGYDPIFIPDGYSHSLAVLSAEEKNAISHRGNAFKKVARFLKERYSE